MSSDQRRDSRNFLYLCTCFVPTRFRFGLKGNRVRVPDSPAAVTFSRGSFIYKNATVMIDGKASD